MDFFALNVLGIMFVRRKTSVRISAANYFVKFLISLPTHCLKKKIRRENKAAFNL